jgi:flagellar biosynthesis protein
MSDETSRRRAVALRYESNAGAPRVLAKGQGFVAERLLARAQELGVPLRAEPELVELLLQLELNQVIPPTLYAAVAEVLAWAYDVDRRTTEDTVASRMENIKPAG